MSKLIDRKNKEKSAPKTRQFSRKDETLAVSSDEIIDPSKGISVPDLVRFNVDRDLSIWDSAVKKKGGNKKVIGDITYRQVEEAIFTSGGMITNISKKLSLSVYHIKRIFDKHKTLGKLFEELREALLDEIECHLMEKIRGKQDTTAMIFALKCLGKGRGWIEAAGGVSGKKAPVKMKIVPATEKSVKKAKGNVVNFRKVSEEYGKTEQGS